jgi:hypothetical protein
VRVPVEADESGELVDLFLSHRSINDAEALRLAERLEGEQHPDGRWLRVWLDLLDVRPGQSIVGRINAGLAQAHHVGLLLTPAYLDSPSGWTDAEWQAALFDDPAGRSSRVVPLLLESCPDLPPLLRHLHLIDLRGAAYEAGYQQLVRFLRGESPRAHRFRGQLVRPDGRVSAETLAAERALDVGAPDQVEERLLGNVLPVIELPRRVWTAPIAGKLARGSGASRTYPSKERLKELIRDQQERTGRKPFMPAFHRLGDELVTFHRLDRPAHPLGPVTAAGRGRATNVDAWVDDPDRRRVLTALLNMAVQRHLFAQGMVYEHERRRHFFPRTPDGGPWQVRWRRRARPRTVAAPLVAEDGRVFRWRHSAVRLPVVCLGGQFFIQIRPTIVFTEDGTVESILRGSAVGPWATAWLGQERNLQLLYHAHFWAFVLGGGKTPIRIRAGDQALIVDPSPLEIVLDHGIVEDQVNLVAQLEDAPDPDEDWELGNLAPGEDADEEDFEEEADLGL